ncbi:AAA-domain-containing protein [Mycena venus]|uniref:AAA-domain-containing protein n=1 Tax=Mycena venus TaxID=2733690 RepID=A0A8H6YH97_9AGAR|nr:AAA-domain-containing protein [Mycena venus]
MFINRYQGKGIGSRGGGSVRLRGPQRMELRFTRIVRVGLLQDPPHAVPDISQSERRKRFLLANLWLIHHNAGLEGNIFDFDYDHYCHEARIDEGSNSKILNSLESSILGDDQLRQVASILPSSTQFSDVLHAFTEAEKHMSSTEWRKILEILKSGLSPVGSQLTVDPIVARVRGDSSLNSHEQQLLSCVIDPATIRTTFADVCIKPEVTDTLRTAVSYPILFPEAYTTGILAQESIGGVLLFGPPGTGKTMACRALAKECGARMIQLQASTIQHCYCDISSAAWSLARHLGPCMIFIDEVDALFCKRDGSSKQWHRTMVTEFTQEMDGLNTADANQRTGLVVVGATNRPQDIDSAVVRRLSRRILVDLPTSEQRKAIIAQYLNDEVYDETVNIAVLADRTQLFSGSDLRYLVHAVALAALKDTMPLPWQVQGGVDEVHGPTPESSRTSAPRVIQGKHFEQALKQVSASNSTNRQDLDELKRWERESFQSGYNSQEMAAGRRRDLYAGRLGSANP